MRPRRYYVLLAMVLGIGAAVLPAIASSETSPNVQAVNTGLYSHSWSPAQVTIAAGGSVSLSNPTTVPHGVEWHSGPSTPTCSGVPVGTESGTEWSGSCKFAQAGTYVFYCTVHGPEMTGTVTVSADGTITTTTTTTPTGTTTTPAGTKPPVQEAPAGPPITGSPTVRAARHGTSVTGSLQVSAAGAGDRLEVDLIADGAALAKGKQAKHVTVGRFVRSSVKAGKQSFTVKLDASARHALKRRHRLALTVKVVLTPGYGNPTTRTRTVIVHG